MIPSSLIKRFLCLLTALLPVLAWALPSDRQQPIHISSDSAEIDDIRGVSIYRGQVKMTQGSINITGEMITIHQDKQGVSKLIAVGQLAHYQQLPEQDKPVLHAYGETIEYFAREERIKIKQQAKIVQELNTFSGERIDYDIKKRLVNAYSNANDTKAADKGSRVNMVIQPNNPATDDDSTDE